MVHHGDDVYRTQPAQDTLSIDIESMRSMNVKEEPKEAVARVVSEGPYSIFSHGAKLFIVFMVAGAALMSAFVCY
jgi:hypothetical protein